MYREVSDVQVNTLMEWEKNRWEHTEKAPERIAYELLEQLREIAQYTLIIEEEAVTIKHLWNDVTYSI